MKLKMLRKIKIKLIKLLFKLIRVFAHKGVPYQKVYNEIESAKADAPFLVCDITDAQIKKSLNYLKY